MTAATVGLAAAYLLLALLLLSLNLRSAWGWAVKAVAIGATAGFFVVGFLALLELIGWPSDAAPPGRFRLHAAVVHEPDRDEPGDGAIYLWLSPRQADGEAPGPPRAYAMPYSRSLHEQTVKALERLQSGQTVDGRARPRSGWSGRFTSRETRVELFLPPPAGLPPKSG